ncbi:MAG TPA: lipopolysaccharide biosynthesis protein [Lacipirellulaceae bacterium]|nr:lipopolysaccharide biosynthesis protein [Lacipirellulaceae bacterium]
MAELKSTEKRHLTPDTFVASVAILLVANLIQRSIGFGRSLLFCRWLPEAELGKWELAYSFLLLAAPVIVLGLPGSFGRYLERYRQRGQLRTFLRRATMWSAIFTLAGCAVIIVEAPRFSKVIFDDWNHSALVIVLSVNLAAVVLHHYLEALFSAFRKFSIVSTMHFCQSISFAIISLVLLCVWRTAAESIIIGYGTACLISVLAIGAWKVRAVLAEAPPDSGIPYGELLPYVRFAFWVWLINLFCHLFGVVDKFMFLHYSGLNNDESLKLLGDYHASRVIPILFLSVADLLGGAVMPYLSHDWELGLRQKVSDMVNSVLKVAAVVMLTAGAAVLWVAPLLFHYVFQGRLDRGLIVMPWTMTYCVWYSLFLVAQNYAWCAEKAKLAMLPLIAGLLVNVAIDLFLIPTWGLLGAVVGTTVATGIATAMLYWINRSAGMELQSGTLLLSLAPLALCSGALGGTMIVLLIAISLPFSKTLVTSHERAEIHALIGQLLKIWNGYWSRSIEPQETAHAV